MNAEQPFFSIIMPCYNAERYLKDALDSVLAQTFTDWELLLIDDGSKDHSLAIAHECLKNEPRAHIFSVPNGGVSKARNIGLDHAQGEWIFFMDADDLILPSHLQSYADAADCDIVFQGWTLFEDETRQILKVSTREPESAMTPETIIEAICHIVPKSMTFGATWSKLFRRSLIEHWHLRFKEDISTAEDRIFTAEYINHIQTLRVLGEATYWYRRSANSAVGNFHKPDDVLRQMNYYRQAFDKLLRMPKVSSLVEEDYGHLCGHLCHMLYYPWHLTLSKRKRHECLQLVLSQYAAFPTDELRNYCRENVAATDRAMLLKYPRACARSVYHSLLRKLRRVA